MRKNNCDKFGADRTIFRCQVRLRLCRNFLGPKKRKNLKKKIKNTFQGTMLCSICAKFGADWTILGI